MLKRVVNPEEMVVLFSPRRRPTKRPDQAGSSGHGVSISPWGYPQIAGLFHDFHGKSTRTGWYPNGRMVYKGNIPSKVWMMTGGTPMTKRKPQTRTDPQRRGGLAFTATSTSRWSQARFLNGGWLRNPAGCHQLKTVVVSSHDLSGVSSVSTIKGGAGIHPQYKKHQETIDIHSLCPVQRCSTLRDEALSQSSMF